MKTNHIICSFLLFLFITGCNKDVLDKKPLDEYSDADFWVSPDLAITAVNECYTDLAPYDDFHDYESFTNNSQSGMYWSYSLSMGSKGWNASDANKNFEWVQDGAIHHSDGNNFWKMGYAEIRKTNVCIVNLGKTAGTTERLTQLLGEAKFLRAYRYHELTRVYGGVIIVDKPLGLDADLNVPRNTYKECVDFMIKDLDEAIAVLPVKWDDANTGRATKGAALALKGRILLYAERWADAAAVYKEVITSGTYGLFPDYQKLFWQENENNEEIVLDLQCKYPEFKFWGNSYALPITQNGYACACPTQNLVDQFDLLDGKRWDDPTSEYYNPSDPFANRDLRFYGTVQHDQGEYFGKRLETGTGKDGNGDVVQGIDLGNPEGSTPTGYYLLKSIEPAPGNFYLPEDETPNTGTNIPLIRYAEVLLGYAEAQNEAAGPDGSVYDAVNQIRTRAGLPNLPAGLSKDDMQAKIRKERRVELAFEYIYYWDCLRWRDRGNLADDKTKGIDITYTYDLNPDGTVKVDETDRKVVLSRTFNVKDTDYQNIFNLDTDYGWFFPIPQDEIDKNPNLIQNGAFTGNNKQ